jgi:hypothetical protein
MPESPMPAARRFALLTLLLLVPHSAHAEPLFASDYLGLPVGPQPATFGAGDLNGDGVDDLVVGDNAGIACLVAQGDGEFAPLVRVDSVQVTAIAIAELTGDGTPDLAVVGRILPEIRIYPGRGDGTFEPAFALAFRAGSLGLLARDFDGDGRTDLVGSDPASRSIWTWLARRDGSFAGPSVTDANVPPSRILAGDLDGDGALDLFLLHANAQNGFTLMRNDGQGAFGPPVLYDGPGGSRLGATGDFDGDGVPDVAIPRSYVYPTVYAVAVWSGRRDGTFTGPVSVPALGLAAATTVADFDRDGRDDLALMTELGAFWVQRGSAQGLGPGPQIRKPRQSGPPSVAGRFDADDRPDLASSEYTQSGGGISLCNSYRGSTVFVWRGDGSGGFHDAPVLPTGTTRFTFAGKVAAADLDGDGHVDLASTSDSQLVLSRGRGDGTFEPPVRAGAGASTRDLRIADLDRDGRPEIVTVTSAAVVVHAVDTSFHVTERARQPIGLLSFSLAVNDFDGDGRLDLAITHTVSPPLVQLFLAGPVGDYATRGFVELPLEPRSIASADLDHDGRADLLVGADDRFGGSGRLLEYRGLGDATFRLVDSLGTELPPAAIAVLDHGPHRDVGVLAGLGQTSCSDETVGVLVLRLVEGVFAREQGPLFLGGRTGTLDAVDVTGDRIADLVGAGDRGRIGVRPGLPDGRFGERRDFGVTTGVTGAAVADFDEDGRLDVAAATVGGVAILFNRGGAVPQAPAVIARLGAGGADAILAWGDVRPLPLVLAGTEELDVSTLDPASFRLAGARAIRSRVRFGDGVEPAPPSFDGCAVLADGADGRTDLEVVFRTDEVLDGWLRTEGPSRGSGESARVAALPFTARRLDGTAIAGTACAVIVGHPVEEERASPATLRAFGVAPGRESGVGVVLTLPVTVANVDVAVYDVAGRRMATLEHGTLPAGVHRLTWSALGEGAGTRPGAGIYFVRAQLDGQRLHGRLIVAR